MRRMDGDLAVEDQAGGGDAEGLAVEEVGEESGVVAQSRLHRAGGVGVGALFEAEGAAVCVVAVSAVGVEGRLPDHAGTGHVQRGEDPVLDEVGEGFAGDGFDDELGEIDALAGVGVARAGFEMDVKLAILLEGAPIGKAGGVAEEDAQSELLPAGIALEVGVAGVLGEWLGKVLGDGLVEIEDFVADEAHDEDGEGSFAQRGRGHDGVGCERQVAPDVARAVGLEVNDAGLWKMAMPAPVTWAAWSS